MFVHTGRIVLAFGAVPALTTVYARTKISESPRYTAQIEQNAEQADANLDAMFAGDKLNDNHINLQPRQVDMSAREFFWKYKWQLMGTTTCWFMLDVAFYSQGLFQSQVFLQVGFVPPAGTMYALEESARNAKAQSVIALGSTIPGYWATVLTVDILGRKFIQIMGFTLTTSLFFALAATFYQLLDPNTPSNRYLSNLQPTGRNGKDSLSDLSTTHIHLIQL